MSSPTSVSAESPINVPSSPAPNRKRKALILSALLGVIVATSFWIYERSHWVAIDDARIAANIIAISSKLPGRISSFPVDDGQKVEADHLLLQIDSRDAALMVQTYDLKILAKQAAIERAQAQLQLTGESVQEQVKFHRAQLQSSEAGLAKAESEQSLAKTSFIRADTLRKKQLLSEQGWEQQRLALQIAERGYQQAQAELNKHQAELSRALASLHKSKIDERSLAVLQQEQAQLHVERELKRQQLDDHQVRSPIQGVVDRTFVHAGEYVVPGKRLLMLHDPNDLWVSANVKETELSRLRIGALAQVWVDSYPDQPFQARVERIDHATTSQFALLPNPNPSGNFTKVTQRVGVRLALSEADPRLKPGMMVEVKIDTRS